MPDRGKLPDPELVTRLLTPRRLLDVLMRRSLSPPHVRCLTNSTELHPRDYIIETTSRRGQAIPMVDMHRLGHLLESGCTLVVDAINRWDATMEVACRAWQWWGRERVQVNTYLTTQDTSGFTLHWDDHDVVIVQLAGEKITVAAKAVPALRMLLCGQPVDLAAVSAAAGVDATTLADVLIKEGLCAEVTDELLSGYTGLIPNDDFWKLPWPSG